MYEWHECCVHFVICLCCFFFSSCFFVACFYLRRRFMAFLSRPQQQQQQQRAAAAQHNCVQLNLSLLLPPPFLWLRSPSPLPFCIEMFMKMFCRDVSFCVGAQNVPIAAFYVRPRHAPTAGVLPNTHTHTTLHIGTNEGNPQCFIELAVFGVKIARNVSAFVCANKLSIRVKCRF